MFGSLGQRSVEPAAILTFPEDLLVLLACANVRIEMLIEQHSSSSCSQGVGGDHRAQNRNIISIMCSMEATELSLPLLEVAFHEPRDVTPRFMVGSLQGGRGWPSRLVGARKNLYLGQGPRTSLL
ncbi:hypothetical protein J6590_009964 [Homalodisca vitripennis]|nr:hypothetical protein J6590_009964 [Homalodisca vitripennis]